MKKMLIGFLTGIAVCLSAGYIADPRDVVLAPQTHGSFALIEMSRTMARIAGALERMERKQK